MLFRIYHQQQGGHEHCTLFVGKGRNYTLGNAGNFTLTLDEFDLFKQLLGTGRGDIEVDWQDRPSSEGPGNEQTKETI